MRFFNFAVQGAHATECKIGRRSIDVGFDDGDWPSGKAVDSGSMIGGSNPSSPANVRPALRSGFCIGSGAGLYEQFVVCEHSEGRSDEVMPREALSLTPIQMR